MPWNLGFITFENFWHEKLKYVRLHHTAAHGKPTDMTLYNIEHGKIIKKQVHLSILAMKIIGD